MLKPPSDSQVGGWVAEPKDYMKRFVRCQCDGSKQWDSVRAGSKTSRHPIYSLSTSHSFTTVPLTLGSEFLANLAGKFFAFA